MGHASDFERELAKRPRSLPAELLDFIATNKKWWLLPVILVLLLLGGLVILSGSAVAPFIYTLF